MDSENEMLMCTRCGKREAILPDEKDRTPRHCQPCYTVMASVIMEMHRKSTLRARQVEIRVAEVITYEGGPCDGMKRLLGRAPNQSVLELREGTSLYVRTDKRSGKLQRIVYKYCEGR